MNWGRKEALLMLAVVVLWTTMPAFACLPAMHSTEQSDCCNGMAHACDSSSMCAEPMCADGSCCQVHRQNAVAAMAPVYSPENSLELAFAPHPAGLQSRALAGVRVRSAFEAPPPKFLPDGAFILRI